MKGGDKPPFFCLCTYAVIPAKAGIPFLAALQFGLAPPKLGSGLRRNDGYLWKILLIFRLFCAAGIYEL